jgi:hypothetical protein
MLTSLRCRKNKWPITRIEELSWFGLNNKTAGSINPINKLPTSPIKIFPRALNAKKPRRAGTKAK